MPADLINLIKRKLQGPLPGIEAQYEMAPISRAKYNINELDPSSYRKSAVMLLLCKSNGSFYIPLVKRHEYDGNHSNQIGLPGGKFDEADKTLENTALRELQEEIGLKKERVELLGALTPLYIPISNFYVEPYIGVYDANEIDFTLDAHEVKQLILLELDTLLNDSIIEPDGNVTAGSYKLKTPYFNVEGEVIWGATAMILNEFKTLIT